MSSHPSATGQNWPKSGWCDDILASYPDFQLRVTFRTENASILKSWDFLTVLTEYRTVSRWQRFWHSWLDGDPHLVSDHTLTGLQEGASLWISSQVFVRDNHLGIIHTNQGTTNYESETRLLCQLAVDSRLQVTDWWMGDYQNNYQGPVPSGSDSQSLLDYLWRRESSL